VIEVFNNPLLLDFLKVAVKLPQDERDQLEAIAGQPYDIDGVAVGNFMTTGPKWVIKAHGEPIVVGGFEFQRKGVWRDFMLTTPEAWTDHWFPVTRICRRIMDSMFSSGTAHRLECISDARRTKAHDWYRVLGYHQEARMHGYCASGHDALMYSRVKH
jgi:hypothetical protein